MRGSVRIFDSLGRELLPKYKVGDKVRWKNTGQAAIITEITADISIPSCNECERCSTDLEVSDVFGFNVHGKFWQAHSTKYGISSLHENMIIPFDVPWNEMYWGKYTPDKDQVEW